MKKYVDGIVFDTDKCPSWDIAHFPVSNVTYKMHRVGTGQWVKEEYHSGGGSNKFDLMDAAKAAEEFTKYKTDLPSVLITDLSKED